MLVLCRAVPRCAVQAAKSGRVPRDLVKAIKRRKMYARKGGRKGEGERRARAAQQQEASDTTSPQHYRWLG